MIIASFFALQLALLVNTDILLTDSRLQISDCVRGLNICVVRVKHQEAKLSSVWMATYSADRVKLIRQVASSAEQEVQERDRLFIFDGICAVIIQTGMYSRRLAIYNVNESRMLPVPDNLLLMHPYEVESGIVGSLFQPQSDGGMKRFVFVVSKDGFECASWPEGLVDFWVRDKSVVLRTKSKAGPVRIDVKSISQLKSFLLRVDSP